MVRKSQLSIWKIIKMFFIFFLVYLMCRRGNDSQRAAKLLQVSLKSEAKRIKDIVGGIHAWSRTIDPSFPIY